jgi:hypothetical protein
MVGMGSLVTKSVADFHLVLGHPAASVGFVCRCGQLVSRWAQLAGETAELPCPACALPYRVERQQVTELRPPA